MVKPIIPVRSDEGRDVLSSPKRPGFHRRWVRNTEEDIERMEELGYRIAKKDDSTPITRRELILMEMPQSQYDERVRAKVAGVYARREARNIRAAAARETDRLSRATGIPVTTIGEVEITGGTSESR